LGQGLPPPALYKPAAALRVDVGEAVGGERVLSTPGAGLGETGGESLCGAWDEAWSRLLWTSRRLLCGLMPVRGSGEIECGVPPPRALVRPAAGSWEGARWWPVAAGIGRASGGYGYWGRVSDGL